MPLGIFDSSLGLPRDNFRESGLRLRDQSVRDLSTRVLRLDGIHPDRPNEAEKILAWLQKNKYAIRRGLKFHLAQDRFEKRLTNTPLPRSFKKAAAYGAALLL